MTDSKPLDLVIIGGGINGAGIAADASGRGLAVALYEMNDLASATSSASTKLIHGGLRYLENYEFALVRKSLQEREVLLAKAPHIIRPLALRLPHRQFLRPKWMIRLGLFLYDFLGKRVTLPRSRKISFSQDGPLQASFKDGFEYYDAKVDDSRLVILNARQAQDNGAAIHTRMECVSAIATGGVWELVFLNHLTGQQSKIHARAVVNATGPWVSQLLSGSFSQADTHQITLVKGCHIIVPNLYSSSEAYFLQNDDGRVVFVIPYAQDFTLIGTTEVNFQGDPASAVISDQEVDYLIDVVNTHFKKTLTKQDVVHHFAGVRPLVGAENGENTKSAVAGKISRDYRLHLNIDEAPLVSVYGGKITTYRLLAEQTMALLKPFFTQMTDDWTEQAALPGGDFSDVTSLRVKMIADYPWMPAKILERWLESYGSLIPQLINTAQAVADFGVHFGHGLYQQEVDYLKECEWALTPEDILWRRSKLGLIFSSRECKNLQDYLQQGLQYSNDNRLHQTA
ncbi:MAG: glycerol-3-phosphate dehydrogenase [SAR86 cluster bacterium]|uniref:Glycerol-3-phosphate dehydrogenase n=1 Tax=SAR86 cluster bacterium TaxID=2030880 RepID=A0A2A4MSE6_9GAMM|nr:MAG: glycerol-3-phosphate dehydrogenase [SAR86 cluster bacterium]